MTTPPLLLVHCLLAVFLALTVTAASNDTKSTTTNHKHGHGEKALTGRFIHVTDFHLDEDYKEGSSDKELCHRGKGDAGVYGAVKTDCDSSPELIRMTFDFIRNKIGDVDFVIYTGDSARHDRDDDFPRTKKQVVSAQEAIVKHFTDTFDTDKIKVLPVIGNNDVIDHNQCGANDDDFKVIQNIWKPLGLNTTDDFEYGGYLVEDVVPGKIRTIHTNTLLFYKDNDAIKDDCDKKGSVGANHIKWIKQVLDDSRKQGYSVYILAHIPPTSKKDKPYYTSACTEEYFTLLGEYEDVIAAHFAGHYNNDILSAMVKKHGKYEQVSALAKKKKQKQFKKMDLEHSNFITPLFNTPSVIPTFNPSIRVFEYDTEGKEYPVGTIRDWWQYYLDLQGTDNGRSKDVEYELEYQASKLFDVDHFDGAGIQKVFGRMKEDEDLHEEYIEHATVSTSKDKKKDKKKHKHKDDDEDNDDDDDDDEDEEDEDEDEDDDDDDDDED
ncbi:endopolyphosphatase [Lichtheimia corymbifera JMRC:FSU:9682]|uniref:Endopolyphosphatase n=1 Tax=Lichtheimia corymbifera JMRC:FSU:9682 TaxID=1263082 RepID=A0A068RR84_9FUNG|nr:endopolyphosphatase [Lichtheimia corymbifera JMRC:FSU:9682]